MKSFAFYIGAAIAEIAGCFVVFAPPEPDKDRMAASSAKRTSAQTAANVGSPPFLPVALQVRHLSSACGEGHKPPPIRPTQFARARPLYPGYLLASATQQYLSVPEQYDRF